MIIGEVFPGSSPRMCLVNHDDVIEALAAPGSTHPFAGGVLPRALKLVFSGVMPRLSARAITDPNIVSLLKMRKRGNSP